MKGHIIFEDNRLILPIIAIILVILWLVNKSDYVFTTANLLAIYIIAVTGLNILIGATGQVSIGHAAFMGIAAYISGILSSTLNIPIWLSGLIALATVGAVSLIIAFPTLRLEGNYLVMATLGINIIVQIIMNQWEPVTGGPSGFSSIPRISLAGYVIDSDRKFFVFIWFITLFLLWITLNFERTRIGRAFKAVKANKTVAEVSGIPVNRYRIIAFVISATYAGIAGLLYAHYITFISPKTFSIFTSLKWLTMSVLGGMGNIWGGVLGTTFLTVVPEILHKLEDFHILLYGSILMCVLIFCPEGLVPTISKRILHNRPKPSNVVYSITSNSINTKTQYDFPARREEAVLKLEDVSLGFGGLQVLLNVTTVFSSLNISAIIGPNGAGKTSLLNVICGIVRAQKGSVKLFQNGESLPLEGLPTHVISEKIGRTFQITQGFPGMTVLDHILIGMHRYTQEGITSGLLDLPSYRKKMRLYEEEALMLLEQFQLREKAFSRIEALSLFENKLLEIARAVAGRPLFLLLDEPGGGLSSTEKTDISFLIKDLALKGIGIIFIDHHMDIVMNLADRVTVLHQGVIIAEGSPTEISEDPEVIRAYLGPEKGTISFPAIVKVGSSKMA